MSTRVFCLLAGCALLTAWPAPAQDADDDPLAAAYAEGVEALRAGAAAQAVQHLQRVVDADAAYDGDEGVTAYLLGHALLQAGRVADALAAWQRGLNARTESGVLDVALADDYVRAVYATEAPAEAEAHRAFAADVYLWLLRSLDYGPTPADRARLERHLEVVRWVVPPGVAARLGEGGAGEVLASWWRSQDPLPATAANERVEEHLQRVAYAEAHFQHDGAFDDRARIFVRFGWPTKRMTLGLDEGQTLRQVVFENSTESTFTYPANEFWVYSNVDRSGHHLFVDDLGHYRLGDVNDFIPGGMRAGLSGSRRGTAKARALTAVFANIYEQLSILHDDYAMRYVEAAEFLNLLETGFPTPQTPSAFAHSMMARETQEHAASVERRERDMPPSHTNVLDDFPTVSIAARHARFLRDDGRTRTEVYWALTLDAHRLPEELPPGVDDDAYLLHVTALQRTGDYHTRGRQTQRLLAEVDGTTLPRPQTVAFEGDAGTYHLAVQWDQHVLRPSVEGDPRPGPRVGTGVLRLDSLRALDASAGLLLSDLRPERLDAADSGGAPMPYPFEALTPETPLAFYFEVYGLAFDGSDATRYTVAYEVASEGPTSPLGRLLRSDGARTEASTTYTGASRTARERIGLDLSRWRDAGPITVTVRVTDEVTGAEAERSMRFRMVEE